METKDSEVDDELADLQTQYRDSIDFAFFVTNYNYSRSDYEQLTPMDKLFIRKAHENKLVEESTMIRNAVLNAVSNALRKKGSKFQDLWKKKQQPINKEVVEENLSLLEEIEEKEGKSWVDLIYKANGFKPPKT